MFELCISEEETADILADAREMRNYPDEKPFPEKPVCRYSGNRCLHVVLAADEQYKVYYVKNVYEPNPDEWEEGFLRRVK